MTKLRQKLSPVHFISSASNKKPPAHTCSYLPRNKNSLSMKKMVNRLCCLKEACYFIPTFIFEVFMELLTYLVYQYIIRFRSLSSPGVFSLTSVSISQIDSYRTNESLPGAFVQPKANKLNQRRDKFSENWRWDSLNIVLKEEQIKRLCFSGNKLENIDHVIRDENC